MSELTPEQRARRGEAAKRAVEDFFDPAMDHVHSVYSARLKTICANEPWETGKIAALANATRIIEEVSKDILTFIYDGEEAAGRLIKAERIEKLSPTKRKFLGYAPF
jgi:hypothetical protein